MGHKKTDEGYPIFRSYLETEKDEPYYSMQTLSFYYEDMERKQELIETLAKKIVGYDMTLTDNLETIQREVEQRVNAWDEQVEQLPDTVNDLLVDWVTDGTIDTIIEDARLNLKADKVEMDNKIFDTAKGNKTPKGRKQQGALTSFVTDDAKIEDMTIFRPIFNRQGVPFCTTAVPDFIEKWSSQGTYCTVEQLKTLQDEGHEIMSHSYYHQILNTLSDSALEIEMRASKEYLQSRGLSAKNFAIPYGQYDDRVRLLAQKHYRSMRSSEGYFNTRPIVSFLLNGIWIVNETVIDPVSKHPRNTFEHYKHFIDLAHNDNSWLIISTHSWEIRDWGMEALLEQIVEYAKTKSRVVTVDQALDETENLLESSLFSKRKPYDPHFAVSSDGIINSNLMFFKKLAPGSVSATTPLSSYEQLVVSVCNILAGSNSNGFPESKPGVLETYNFVRPDLLTNDLGYAYQTFKPYESKVIYTRTAMANGSWSTWYSPMDDSNIKVLGENAVSATTPIANFESRKITWCQVFGPGAGMPNNRAGLLMTNRMGGVANPTYNYQEFHEINSNRVWRRTPNASGEWLNWWLPTDDYNVIRLADNTVSGTTTITGFASGKITWVRLFGTTGTPNNKAGMLMTNRMSSDASYCWQEFAEQNSNNRYMRRCTTDGIWQPWMQYTLTTI